MVVIPTEKKFDWNHAPLVLITIIIANCFIFFFLQSSDNDKLYEALDSYIDSGFLDTERPIFEDYIIETHGQSYLTELKEEFVEGGDDAVAISLLLHKPFFEHLSGQAENLIDESTLARWQEERLGIQAKFDKISWVRHGLVANNLGILDFFTSQFLHGDVMHLLGNMFFLAICGFAVEAAIGHWRFLIFYLISGVIAGLAQAASDWHSSTPLIGASGAISGVMAMYLAVFQLRKIEFFYWIFFFVGYFRAPALVILPFYIGKEIFSYYSDTESNVAFLAHAGGFIAGGILITASMIFFKKTVDENYLDGDGDDELKNQQALADIYLALEKCRFKDAFKLVNEEIKVSGETFELALIRYNIMKVFKGKHFMTCVLRLWQQNKLTQHEVARLDDIWQAHPDFQNKLTDEYALSLGVKFAINEHTKSAEQIFELVVNRKNTSNEFAMFCQRLARTFAKQGYKNKQAKYEHYSQSLLNGGHGGTL